MVKTRKQSGKDKPEERKATKIVYGKVGKKRVNVKKLTKPCDENLETNSNIKQTDFGLRNFFVRMKRLPIDPNTENKMNTLETECKTNKIKENVAVKAKCGTESEFLVRRCKRKAAENNIYVKTRQLLEQRKTKQNYTKFKKRSLTDHDPPDEGVKNSKEKQNSVRKNELQNLTKKSKFQTQDHVEEQRCLIKLPKIPTEKTATVSTASTLSLNKNCRVKLKRTTSVLQTSKTVSESKAHVTPVKCIVRLKRNANQNSLPSIQGLKESANNNTNRKYLRKLSLTKSFNKLVDNENREKNNLSDVEKENQYTCNSKKDTQILKPIQNLVGIKPSYTSKVLMRNNQPVIKQISKLSLKGPLKASKITPNKPQNIHIESPLGSSVLFNPGRNSTLIDLCSNENKQEEKSNEETKQTSSSRGRLSSENLANKSAEIENLLNSLEDEEENLSSSVTKTNENNCQQPKSRQEENRKGLSNISIINNSKIKFFHHKNNIPGEKSINDKSKNTVATKKRRFYTKRSTIANHDNIYEFLSQSQTTDSDSAKHVDPTADVVKKLIQQGKVQLATNCKGKGKPKFKPGKRPLKQMKKMKQTTDKKLNQLKIKRKKVAFIENKNVVYNEDHFDVDHFQNDNFDDDNENFAKLGEEKLIEKQNISSLNGNNNNNLVINEQEGTFSRLAKSVLINQAGRSNFQTKRDLLKTVRNFISTPINKKAISPRTALQTDLSPIFMPSSRRSQQAASPWRVNEDAIFPKTFNFNRSSGNLPSFSSDFIPSTPRKQKPQIYLNDSKPIVTTCAKSPTKCVPSNTLVIQSPLADDLENMPSKLSNLNEPSVISSFSSNDSNGENMPPPERTPDNQNENERIFECKQLPNPRRALKYRSPLKAINILEVVHLPPYKHPNKTLKPDDNGVKQIEMFGFEEDVGESLKEDDNITRLTTKQIHPSKTSKKRPEEDMFGFEDYLSQTEVSSQENDEVNCDKTANEQNQTIHDKLKCLQKLKPAENELQRTITQSSKYAIKDIPIFDNGYSRSGGKKQRGIKEMLCSTLIDTRPSTSKEAVKQLTIGKFKNTKHPKFGEDINLSELFEDPEPETTFNESVAHRTYIRPQKRKRRLKENNFVMILESDESEEEEDNSAEKNKHSRESANSSNELASKKKRQRKEPKENPALTEFAKEFNELCKEVESYRLVVEKSA